MLGPETMAIAASLFLVHPGALAEDTTTNSEDCGAGWFLLHRACYKLSTDALPWEPALKNCEYDGGTLLSISSVAELNQIKKEIRKANKQQNTWWVGLRRTSPQSSVWEWLDSASPFSPHVTKWNKLQPNNADGKENCVEITSDGFLSDKNCEEVRPFVCERHEIIPRRRLDLWSQEWTTTFSTTAHLTITTVHSTSATPSASLSSSSITTSPAHLRQPDGQEDRHFPTLQSSESSPSSVERKVSGYTWTTKSVTIPGTVRIQLTNTSME